MSSEPVLVNVTGPPASGKTTIARRLAGELAIPALFKDQFKELLADELPGDDLMWSRALGGAAFALLYEVAGSLLVSGTACLIEANFHPELSLPHLERLAEQARVVQVACHADPVELDCRYRARHDDGGRHPVHLDRELAGSAYLTNAFRRDHTLRLPGDLIRLDTTDIGAVDVASIVERVALTSC